MPKQTIKTAIRTVCLMTMLGITPAYAMKHINEVVPQAEKVGQGRFTYLFWDVYDATLYAPRGEWSFEKPFALQLSYLRTFEGKKIADRSAQEIRNQGYTDEIKIAAWHAQMQKIFPDVEAGDKLTGVYTDSGTTIFYKGNVEIGRIDDPEFSAAFFGIWLNNQTSAPDLRLKLLGAS